MTREASRLREPEEETSCGLRLPDLDFGKVVDRLGDVVEVDGVEVQGNVGDDLDDLTIAVAGFAYETHIVDAVLYLGNANFVTGVILPVDGGAAVGG